MIRLALHAARRLGAFGVLLAFAAAAAAQPQTRDFGPYTLRSSTTASDNIAPETARKHGIEPDPRRAVLNVTVLVDGAPGAERTVPAEVQATARTLSGKPRPIEMREVDAGGYVSYIGSYEFVPREVLEFEITARPEGSDQVLSMRYEERLWAR